MDIYFILGSILIITLIKLIWKERQKMNKLISILKYFDNKTIKQIYNLLLEFDNNKYTSNFKEFIINYNKMKG